MSTHKDRSWYLQPLITVIAIVLLSSAGFARMMGWGPNSTAESGDILALDQAGPVPASSQIRVKARCPECGEIVSIREINVVRNTAAAPGGAVAGGHSGTRVISPRTYEVAARMADGSSRVFNDTSPARWRLGERVIIIDGANRPNQ